MKITIADIEIAQSSPEKLAALSGSELEIEEGREWLNFNFDYSIPWPDGLSLPTGLKELYCEDLTSWPDGLALPHQARVDVDRQQLVARRGEGGEEPLRSDYGSREGDRERAEDGGAGSSPASGHGEKGPAPL